MSKRISFDGITPLNDTPSATRASNNDNSSLEDINYLLYLETLKRFKDEESNLRRQVEEKARQYEDAKAEYRCFYELYVQLYQAAVTRGALEEYDNLSGVQLSQTQFDVSAIAEKVSNDKTIAYFNPEVLEKCREFLRGIKNHDEAQEIQAEMADQKATIKIIQDLNEAIEVKLEAATIQGLDYFVELTQAKQMENLTIEEHITNEKNIDE